MTFEDGSQAQVVGKETFNLEGFPKLESVFLVEGLKTNLISISQLCDQDLLVRINRDTYNIYDETPKHNCVVES